MSHNNQTSTIRKIEKSITQTSTVKKIDTSTIQISKEIIMVKKTETSVSPNSDKKDKKGTWKKRFSLKLNDLLEIVRFLLLLGFEFVGKITNTKTGL